jgi:hypothetical protein
MGSSSSKVGEPSDAITSWYRAYMAKARAAGTYEGGDDSPLVAGGFKIGGLPGVEGYGKSIMSSAKQHLIKEIAADMAEKLKIPNLSPRGKTAEEIVEQLKKYVPDPRTGKGNGKTWSDKEASQIKACETMAKIINEHMGTRVIDLRAKPGEICEQVSEIMHSLMSDLHAEFAGVRSDVHRALKNIEVVAEMLRRGTTAVNNRISRETESTIASETATVREAQRDSLVELERQLKMLEGFLGEVINPAEIELDKALKESHDFRNLVKKIKQHPGTGKFAEKVAFALSGIRSVAAAAHVVDSALKKLEMKYSEYAKLNTPKKLEEFLSEKTQAMLKDSEAALEELEKAKKVLYNHEYLHDEVVRELERESRERESRKRDDHSENHERRRSKKRGAAEGEEDMETGLVEGGAKLDKRVKRRQDLQKALLKAFAERLNTIFDRVLVSAQQIGERVGAGKIPLSDVLEKFPRALEIIPDIQKRYVYFSLAGYYNDIRSREEREKFVSAIRYVISVIDDILKDPTYSKEESFKDMRRGFEEIIKLIDDFSTKFTEGFGVLPLFKKKSEDLVGGEDDESEESEEAKPSGSSSLKEKLKKSALNVASETAHVAGVLAEHASQKLGEAAGADEHHKHKKVHGGDLAIPEITRTAYQLNRLRDVILYYFRTARIRVNLAKASVEMQAAGEDYVKILADAVAASVDKCLKERNFIRSQCEDETSSLYKVFVPDSKAPDARERKEFLRAYMEMKEKIYATKVDMYRTAEAVDLYMKAFADGISAHPDDIQNILRILNSTEVISKWFTEKSGDMLCNVFDSFPGVYVGNNAKYPRMLDNQNLATLANQHYYVRVALLCQLGTPATLHNQLPNIIKTPAAGVITWATIRNNLADGGRLNTNQPTIQGAADSPLLPGLPFLGIPLRFPAGGARDRENVAEKVIKYAEKALSVTMLKNIISVFVTVGSHFGGKDLARKSPRSSIQIYKSLMDYMLQSAFSLGLSSKIDIVEVLKYKNPTDNVVINAQNYNILVEPQAPVRLSNQELIIPTVDVVDIPENFSTVPNITIANSTIFQHRFRLGITAKNKIDAAPLQPIVPEPSADVARLTRFAMRGVAEVGSLKTTPLSGSPFANDYEETDCLFVMVIKSMVAKILTSIGVYNMFNRPINQDGLGYFSGLRLILGGAAETPKIIPEALELYIRLPLMAEFYRQVFNFEQDDPASPDFRIISMVPEMDGTFSGLISLIFDRARYVENGNYSETDIRSMIEEINKIWLRFRDSKNIVSDVIHEFIAEVNRRIGIYEREERTRYLEERQKRYDSRYTAPEEITDFELSTIDENDTHFRPTPSMSYQTEGGIAGKRTHKYKLELENHSKYINDVRRKLDQMFKYAEDNYKRDLSNIRNVFSFESLLKARREELKNAKSDKERFDIVHSAITSLGQFAMPTLEKSLIFFHEFVVAPLKTLDLLYNMLNNFYTQLSQLYRGLREVESWTKQPGPLLGGGSLVAGMNDNLAQVLYDNPVPLRMAIAPGRQGLPVTAARVNYQDLNTIATNQKITAGVDQVLYRFVVDQSKVMFKAFELLYGHAITFDGMVECHVDVAHDKSDDTCAIAVKIDHSKLRQYIANVFSSVKESLDKCRGLIANKVLDKYEKYDTPGSLYFLEKRLIDELLDGKWSSDAVTHPLDIKNDNLDRANDKFRHIFDYLTQGWDFNARGLNGGVVPADFKTIYELDPATGASRAVASTKKSHQEFDREIYEMIFYQPFSYLGFDFSTAAIGNYHEYWSPAGAPGGGPTRFDPATAPGILKVLFNTSGKVKDGIPDGQPWERDPVVHHSLLKTIYDPQKRFEVAADARRSIWIMFNRLVAAYIEQVYDSTSGKVYLPTINDFANGAFSSSVLGDEVYYDDIVFGTNDIMGDPDGRPGSRTKGVLVYTLGRILRRFLVEKTHSGDKKQYLETDISEVPLYIKEQMRASLPIFEKMFRYLLERCELAKTMVRALNITQPVGNAQLPVAFACQLGRPTLAGGLPVAPNTFLPPRTNMENERNMTKILDKIISGCQALVKCIQTTLGDIADDPKYLETHQGFIQEYESTNGMMPFMPESSMLYYLRNTRFGPIAAGDEVNDISMPVYRLGSTQFKLQYGTRGVLNHNEIKPADMPGMVQIVKWHNQSSDAKHHMDEKLLDKSLNSSTALIRYMIDAKRYRGAFSLFVRGPAAAPLALAYWSQVPLGNQNIYTHTTANLLRHPADFAVNLNPYSLQTNITLSDVIRMTESNFQGEQRRLIAMLVRGDDPCEGWLDRNKLIIHNIIDLNVVPVNIHSLRREIPLVHLYNYSWTFDKLIRDIFGINDDLSKVYDKGYVTSTDLEGNNAGKKLLGYLTMDPYKGVTRDVYEYFMPQILRGNLGIEGLARPKYLADEVYNKALFGELYPGQVYREEGGPASGDAHLHGKEEILSDMARSSSYLRLVQLLGRYLLILICRDGGAHAYSVLPSLAVGGPNDWEPGLAGGFAARQRSYLAMVDAIIAKVVAELLDENGNQKRLNVLELSNIRVRVRNEALDRGMADPAVFPHVLNHAGAVPPAQVNAADSLAIMTMYIVLAFTNRDVVATHVKWMGEVLVPHLGAPADTIRARVSNHLTAAAIAHVNIGTVIFGKVLEILGLFTGPGGPGNIPFPLASPLAVYGNLNTNNVAGGMVPPLGAANLNATGVIPGDLGLFPPATTEFPAGFATRLRDEFSDFIAGEADKRFKDMPYNARRVVKSSNQRYFPDSLHYLDTDEKTGETRIREVDVGPVKEILQIIGKYRFDTVLVRNLFWITNLQRLLRLKLRRDLTWFDQRVVDEHAVLASGITELYGNDVQPSDFPDTYKY